MNPDYQNWVPKPMVMGLWAGTAIALVLFILFGVTGIILHGTARLVCALVLGIGTLALLFFSVWMTSLHMGKKEAVWLGLGGSTLLVGKK